MTRIDLKVGIITSSKPVAEALRASVQATGQGTVVLEANEYFENRAEPWARRFAQVAPQVVVVDMQEPKATIACLTVLRSLLPGSWLLVHSSPNDANILMEAVRAGAREFLPKPATPAAVAQAFARYIEEKRIVEEPVPEGSIYAVLGAKGGAGATMLAINLATVLAGKPNTRVGLVDLNVPLGSAAAYLNVAPKFGVRDALCSSARLDSTLLESYSNTVHGVHFLAGAEQYHAAELPPAGPLGQLLEVCASTFTHTVVDLSLGLEEEHFKVIAEASEVLLLVLVPEVPALWCADRLLRFLSFVEPDKVKIVLNRVRPDDEITARDVERTLRQRVFRSLPNDYRALLNATNTGKPLVEMDNCDLGRAYRELAEQVSGLKTPEARRSLIGRLLLRAA